MTIGKTRRAGAAVDDADAVSAAQSADHAPDWKAEDRVTLERKYAIKLADAREAAFRLSETAATRQSMLAGRLHDAQQVALQMSRVAHERLQRLSEVLRLSQGEALKLSRDLVAREQELGAELRRVRESLLALVSTAAEERTEMNARLERTSEAVREMNARLERGSVIIDEKSRALAERDRELEGLRKRLSNATQVIDEMRRVLDDATRSHLAADGAAENAGLAPAAAGISRLLTLRGRRFVVEAYRVLLHREPDPEGFRHYLDELGDGVSQVEIAGRIRYSREGRRVGADVRTIRTRLAFAQLYRIPLIGQLLEVIGGATSARRRRAFEHAMFEQLDRTHAANLERTRSLLELRELLVSMETGRPPR